MKTLFLPTLSKAINAYLRLDPESAKRLQQLKGKVVTVELLPFHFIFQVIIENSKIALQAGEAYEAETRITGTPLQMMGVVMNKDDRNQFFADDIRMDGNAELGRQLVELFDELSIDWEEYLSHLVGDVPAYHASKIVRSIKSWFSRAEESFTSNINEYVHEEAGWFPPTEALDDFYNDIDALRMDVDRMEARINHLKDTLNREDQSP